MFDRIIQFFETAYVELPPTPLRLNLVDSPEKTSGVRVFFQKRSLTTNLISLLDVGLFISVSS